MDARLPALVLLHGVASNGTRWHEFIQASRLRHGWRLLAPTLRGNGAAALPRTRLGMDVWCADIARLLDAQRCERAVIGGHCLGANIALQFAARYPQRVGGLVLVEPMPPEAFTGAMARLSALKALLYTTYGAARALNALGVYRRSLAPRDLREWDNKVRSGGIKLSPLASVFADLECTPFAAYARMLAATAEPWPDLSLIPAVPVLALLSSRSTMTDPASTRRILARLPNCEVVELDAVHWIPSEQPAAMRRTIDRFLATRTSAQATPARDRLDRRAAVGVMASHSTAAARAR